MPRNKNTKRLNKPQANRDLLTYVKEIEKDFLQLPAKLAVRLEKEVTSHQRQEIKLQKALTKNQSAITKLAARVKAAGKDANTGKGKKLLKATKMEHKEALQNHNELTKELKTVSKAVQPLVEKQAKLNGLAKYLGQFDKHWAQTSKQLKAKPKKAKVKHPTSTITQLVIEPRVDSTEDTVSPIPMDDSVKVAS